MADEDAAMAELDAQAQVMAEKALEKLPENIRALKIGKVKEGILKRLKDQAAKAAGGAPAQVAPSGSAPPPPSGPPPPPVEEERKVYEKCEGIEAIGDEDWFADLFVRRALRQGVVDAHKEQKLLVASPADEIRRIWPGGGRVLGAGAVLRLGGSHVGGYGEPDIAYAYRQLSRALHPDKNRGVEEAPDAFKRLSEAADELRAGLNDSRNALRLLLAAMGGSATDEMLERPQEALMAESCRLLSAVIAIAGEGEVPPTALTRGVAAFTSTSTFYNCQAQALLSQFFDMNSLLDFYSGAPVRTAYDCSKKRFRAQFLCALNRVTGVEAKRQNECIRGNWNDVLAQYPEMHMWKEMLDKLKTHVWNSSADDPAEEKVQKKSKWDATEEPVKKPCAWAEKWRTYIKAVLPRGIDGAVPMTNPEIRKLTGKLWGEVVEWARKENLDRHLGLFTAEAVRQQDGTFAPPADEWCFVPQADLLLCLGDGLVGTTAEGVFSENKKGHEPVTFEEALAGSTGKEKEKSRSRSGSPSKKKEDNGEPESERDVEKRKQAEAMRQFDWEGEWRNRANRNRRNRSPMTRHRSRSRSRRGPRPRSRSRARRRGRSGSGGRRRSRSRSAGRRRRDD